MKTGSNIILIGMPGAGKSTTGVLLAKLLSKGFTDSDLLIQSACSRSLQDIVDHDGHLELRRIEEEILLSLNLRNHVIATGGSAVYSSKAMSHLKGHGVVIFLDVDIADLKARVADFEKRGLAKLPEQTFEDLYRERLVLYRKYADITIPCSGKNHEEVCAAIIESMVK